MLLGWAMTRGWRVRVIAVIMAALMLGVIVPQLPDMPTMDQISVSEVISR